MITAGIAFGATAAVLLLWVTLGSRPTGPGGDGYRDVLATNIPSALRREHVDAGQALYAEHCASCHGTSLQGQPDWRTRSPDGTLRAPPHDDSGHTWHHDDQMLFEYTSKGGQAIMDASGVSGFRSAMPGFSNTLSSLQINQILAFIKSRWGDRAAEVQRQRSKAR